MANSKQAKKRLRQAEKSRLLNKARSTRMKTEVKRAEEAIATGDATKSEAQLREAIKRIDKAAQKNIIHKNTAARKKSLLARKVAALQAQA